MSEAAPVKQPCPLIMWSCKCCLSSLLAGLNLTVLLVQINGNSLWQAVSFQWNHNMDLVPPLPCSPSLPTPTKVWLPTSGYPPWLSPPTPSSWLVCQGVLWLQWWIAPRALLKHCGSHVSNKKQCFLVAQDMNVIIIHHLVQLSVLQQAGEIRGNTLKSKLANIYGVLMCHCCAFTLIGVLLIY